MEIEDLGDFEEENCMPWWCCPLCYGEQDEIEDLPEDESNDESID